MKLLQWALLAIALGVLPVEQALAQQSQPRSYTSLARDGYRLTRPEAEALESSLAGNPENLATRAKLLGFYFRGAVRLFGPEATIAARRRHILWVIEHHPGSEVAQLSEATIDSSGHALADKDGYEQASKLWMQQVQRHASDVAVLGNAARFFQLADKQQAAGLLKRAQQAAPHDGQWSGRLGYLYALGILGVDMVNQNGLPTSHNAAEAEGIFARLAREELASSTDANMLGTAGGVLGQYGLMMGAIFRERFTVDYAPLAEAYLMKAQQLDPANPNWPLALEQYRKLRQDAERPK